MVEHIVNPTDIGTYYVTENAPKPSIECPWRDHLTPLTKLVLDRVFENYAPKLTEAVEHGQAF